MLKRPKIAVIGAGNVGATCAHWLVAKELGDVVLLDIPEVADQTRGKALDLYEATPIERLDCRITGTSDYDDLSNSDIVVLTAGSPRRPGMSRDDLIKVNAGIVAKVSNEIRARVPNCILIIMTNPLDAMVYAAWKASGFPPARIVGQAGCLDVARFKTFVSEETGYSVEDINALLLGGHGDDMVPLPRFTNVGGIPVTELMSLERLNELVERTKGGGGEIVEMMGTSSYYAAAAAILQMVEAIIRDKKRILPCAALCQGEYGVDGIFVGVPCVLGSGGVEKIIEVGLEADERAAFETSANHVRELVEVVRTLFPELA